MLDKCVFSHYILAQKDERGNGQAVFLVKITQNKECFMNRSELINSLSEETAFSKKDVTRVVDSLVRIIGRTLQKGQPISIAGFGSFWVSNRPARKGINPT